MNIEKLKPVYFNLLKLRLAAICPQAYIADAAYQCITDAFETEGTFVADELYKHYVLKYRPDTHPGSIKVFAEFAECFTGCDVPDENDEGEDDDEDDENEEDIGPYERVRQGIDMSVVGYRRYMGCVYAAEFTACPQVTVLFDGTGELSQAIADFYGDAEFARDVIRACFDASGKLVYDAESDPGYAFCLATPALVAGTTESQRRAMAEQAIAAAGLAPLDTSSANDDDYLEPSLWTLAELLKRPLLPVSDEALKALVVKTEYFRPDGSGTTVCALHLKSGFTVLGESHCADLLKFNAHTGIDLAYGAALNKLREYENYRRLHNSGEAHSK